MKVTKISSQTTKTYTLVVDGDEVRDVQFSRQGRQYRVKRITVTKRDGNVSRIELHGPVLKKDGTEGAIGTTERFYCGQAEWPSWLRSIVGGLA